MSSSNGQFSDYEPVARSRRARLRRESADDAETEWPSRARDDAPEREAEANAAGRTHAASATVYDGDADDAPLSPRRAKPRTRTAGARDSWILKRGHALSYAGLFLFTFILYFRPYEYVPALASFNSMAFWVAVLTLAVFFPTQLALEGTLTTRTREVNLVLLLAACALLSIPLAFNPGEAWATFNDPFVKAVLMFVVMVNVVRTQKRLNGLFFLSVGVGVVLGAGALNDYRSGNFAVEGYRVAGVIGNLFGNPNDLALHFVTMIPIALALLFSARGLHKKLLFILCAALMIGGTVVTFSRGGFLGLAGATLVLAWKIGRRNRFAIMALVLVAVVAFLAFAPGSYGDRLAAIVDSSRDLRGSATARKDLLIQSVVVALRHPLLGVGIGNFHILSIRDAVSHNAYTQVAAEMGIPAMIVYLLFILTPFRALRRIESETFVAHRASHFYYLSVGLQASLVGYMIGSFFASVAYQWYVYYLVGYAISLRRIYETGLQVEGAKKTAAAATDETGAEDERVFREGATGMAGALKA